MSYIYKISCKDLNIKQIYIGSTKNFNKRKWQHKSDCNNENRKSYNSPVYKFIRNNGGWDNWQINIIDCITTIDKKIIKKCEAKYIRDNIDIVLNKDIPGRSDKEYYEENKEKISEKLKVYRKENKEKERERFKIYRENNKQIIKEKAKIFREENREKERGRFKNYYEKNKDEINRKARERRKNKKNDIK